MKTLKITITKNDDDLTTTRIEREGFSSLEVIGLLYNISARFREMTFLEINETEKEEASDDEA